MQYSKIVESKYTTQKFGKKNNMKISIITATYNSAKTIEDTIRSVLSQTYQDFEHIIIDGKSTDNTIEIIEKYKKEYNGRLKIVSEKDKGLYDAMNKGIKFASGDIIGILNSDDIYYDEHSLEKIANTCKNSDGCFGNLIYVDETLKKILRNWKTGEGKIEKAWLPAHPTFYVDKKVYDTIGNYDLKYKICADYDFMIRTIKSEKFQLKYIDDYLVKMRLGGKSSDGLKGYVKNALEANKVLKNNNFRFSEIIIFKRILGLGKQYIKGLSANK